MRKEGRQVWVYTTTVCARGLVRKGEFGKWNVRKCILTLAILMNCVMTSERTLSMGSLRISSTTQKLVCEEVSSVKGEGVGVRCVCVHVTIT